MSTLRLLSMLAFLITAIHAYQLAQVISQNQIQQRATYQGGWALGLPGADCPASAPVKCNADSSSINPTCCPENQLCAGSIYPYCCPSGSDCRSTVQNLPVCANSTWTMYHLTDGQQFFCCESGQFGVLPLRGYAGICVPNDQAVVSSLIATAASQIGGAALTTVVGANPAATSATKTVTSSLKGGGTATITQGVEGTATETAAETSTAAGGAGSGSGSSDAGTSNSSSSTSKPKKSLSTGAKIGVAIGGLAVFLLLALLLFKILQRRKARHGLGAPGGVQAPEYTPQLQPQMQAGYASVTPVQEYKSPVLAGTMPYQGSPSPPPTQTYGGVVGQGNAGGAGGYASHPVEAPQGWERRVEM